MDGPADIFYLGVMTVMYLASLVSQDFSLCLKPLAILEVYWGGLHLESGGWRHDKSFAATRSRLR